MDKILLVRFEVKIVKMPIQIQELIRSQCNQNRGRTEFKTLTRRKDSTPIYKAYELLPESSANKVLEEWYTFHNGFTKCYDSFRTFYSKTEFCMKLEREHLPEEKAQAQQLFSKVLADRKFFFLEFNEHLNSPEFPALSKIVKNPDSYLAEAAKAHKDHAEKVVERGFIPTYAHRNAYREMVDNCKKLTAVIQERERCIEKEKNTGNTLENLYQTVSFKIEPSDGEPSKQEENLCALFKDFILASVNRAYIKRYKDLDDEPSSNYLPAVHGLLSHAREKDLMPYLALLFFHLFTQKTVKLARGTLKKYTFAPIGRRSANTSSGRAQTITQRKVENNIILFDLLLQFFAPEDPSFLKYLFHKYTMYNGYNHFRTSMSQDARFLCLPEPRDSVDQLAGTFRFHIQYCIPNGINWLTPGLPNDWAENSTALATFLLRDAAFLPVYTRLTDRVRRCLQEPEIGDKLVREYREACLDQEETIKLLDSWCSKYKLIFTGEDIAPRYLREHPESLQRICSRFVLEYALKEKLYASARERLCAIAQALFGELCVGGESFYLTPDK